MVFPGCTTVTVAFDRLKKVCDAVTASFPKPVAMANIRKKLNKKKLLKLFIRQLRRCMRDICSLGRRGTVGSATWRPPQPYRRNLK